MLPRDIQPNYTHLIHRRVAKGNEVLLKCAQTRHVLAFALFEAANWFGVELHSAAFLDNEYYLSLNDPHGLLPLMMQRFNHNTAMSLKRLHKIQGVFWEPGRSYDDTVLDNRDDILGALAFVHSAKESNPKRRQGHIVTNGWGVGDTVGELQRPEGFWGRCDPVVEARLVMPELLKAEQPEMLKQQIQEMARAHHWPRGSVRKPRSAKRQRKRGRPKPRFRLTPGAERRRLHQHDRFQRAYRKRWKALQRGVAGLFPWGTWWLAFHAIVSTTAG